jgi:hypothetical protein
MDSSTALGHGLDDWGAQVLAGTGNFFVHHCVQTSSVAHPSSYPMGTRESFPGVKCPGHEADHSPNAKVKNAWNYTSTPQNTFMAWCLVKAQEQLYLYLQYMVSY